MLTGVLNVQPGEPGYEEYQRAMTEQKIAWTILAILDWPLLLISGGGLILIQDFFWFSFDLFWLYFLSCLIVWIYDKVKKK